MSDFQMKPKFRQCFVTYMESDGKEIIFWAQNDTKEVLKFESIRETNYRQMFNSFFNSKRDFGFKPLVDKHYIFCDKSSLNFYRVLVKTVDSELNKAFVFFIDFGYEDLIDINCLFVFKPLFIDCLPLAQRFVFSDIRPKDPTKGFCRQRVIKSLEKYFRSLLMFAIYSDKRIKVFNNDGEEVIKSCLESDGIDDIIFETNDSDLELIAIEFNNNSEESSLTLTSDFKSPQSLSQLSEDFESAKESENSSEINNDLKNETKITTKGTQTTLSSLSSFNEKVFSDKTDKKSLIFHMKTLFGPKRLVYVTKTLSSKSIYVQLSEDWEQIQELCQRMNDCYQISIEENEYPLKVKDIELDSVIASRFTEDDNWYRSKVIQVFREKSLVKVFYLDFGNSETLDLKFCRFLRPEFRQFPPKAIHCRPLNKRLEVETLEIFETNTQEIECQFIALNDQIMDVLLFDNGVLLNGDSVQSSPQRLKLIQSSTEEEETNEETEQRIEIEKELSEKVIQSQNLFEESLLFFCSLEESDQKIIISKAINTQLIYCQLFEKIEEELNPLVEDMNDFYNAIKKDSKPLTDFELREINETQTLIGVYCDLENRWLRAKIITIFDSETVEVFYVDYGTHERLEREKCLQLDDIYFKPLIQAIPCQPINKSLTYYELKRIESSEKALKIRFLGFNKESNVFEIKLNL